MTIGFIVGIVIIYVIIGMYFGSYLILRIVKGRATLPQTIQFGNKIIYAGTEMFLELLGLKKPSDHGQ